MTIISRETILRIVREADGGLSDAVMTPDQIIEAFTNLPHKCPHCFQPAQFWGLAHEGHSIAYSCRHCLRVHYAPFPRQEANAND